MKELTLYHSPLMPGIWVRFTLSYFCILYILASILFFLLHVDHIWTPTHFIFTSPKLHFLLKLLQIKQKKECLCTLYNKRIIHVHLEDAKRPDSCMLPIELSHWEKKRGHENIDYNSG